MTGAGYPVTLLPGDGIGPDVVDAARRVLDATGVRLEWQVFGLGQAAMNQPEDHPLPDPVLESIRSNRVALKGPVSTATGNGFRSVNIGLRRELDLYCQVRMCRSFPGKQSGCQPIDLVVMRETTEDLYAGVEFQAGTPDARQVLAVLEAAGASLPSGAGLSIKYTSEQAVRRTVSFAFDWARRNGRGRITIAHKATVMRFTDGLFLSVARELATGQTTIEMEDCSIDNLAAQLVRHPERFDVIVTSNLYGDILSDLTAALVGSVGLVPGANFGDGIAVFEPAHGSAPRHAGYNRANPIAAVLSGSMMLRHLGEPDAAQRVEHAVSTVVAEGRSVTYDLAASEKRAVSTDAAADAIIKAMT